MKRFKKIITLIPLIVLSLTPLLWFKDKGNVLINGIDTNFPLDPWMWFLRRFYVWTDFPNGGQDFSSSTAGIFFHFIQALPYKLGFTLQNVEIFSLIFWFALIIFSSYFLAKTLFAKSVLIQLLFVVLYAFNIYVFNTWENVKVANLALVSAIPLGITILILLKEKRLSWQKAIFFSSLTGVILSGAGINPSYFITFFLILLILSISQILADFKLKTLKQASFNLMLILLPIVLVNLFWIFPTVNFITRNIDPSGSIGKIGFNNWVDSLSENTSLLNVMRLQGAWDWYAFDQITGLPLYIPYALNYFYRVPFILFSFLLPMFVIISLFIRTKTKNYLYIAFGIMFILGVFLGAGTHPPSGTFFNWLSQHLPFFTIFRSPWYIFTPLVTLSSAALVCSLFHTINKELFRNKILLRLIIPASILVLIVGNLVYTYPLVTGKIFRPARHDGFFVEFPSYTFAAKDWLDTQENGRIVGYPDDEIEQFSWGYRGIESILGLLTNHEMLFNPLNAPDSNSALLIKQFYKHLGRGELEAANAIADKLNIGLIFEKTDQQTLAPSLPSKFKENIAASFGPWNFYRFSREDNPSKLGSVNRVFLGYPYFAGARLVDLMGKDELLINSNDTVPQNIRNLTNLTNLVIKTENSQFNELTNFNNSVSQLNNRLLTRDMSEVSFDFYTPAESLYQPILDRYELEDFGLNVLVGKSLELELDGIKQIWEVVKLTDSFVYFKTIKVSKGQHKAVLKLDNRNMIKNGDFEGPFSFEHKFVEKIQVEKNDFGRNLNNLNTKEEIRVEENGNGHSFSILNKNKSLDLSTDFTITSFNSQDSYLIEVKYLHVYGDNASVIIYQNKADTLIKAQTESLPNYPQINNFSFFYEPVRTNSTAKVSLLAPSIDDPVGTKVLYDDLAVYKVFTNQMFFREVDESKLLPLVRTNIKKVSPVLYEGEVDGGSKPHILTFAENYSPDWELVLFNKDGERLQVENRHLSANLYANAWYIDNAPENYKFEFFYKPQRLFWLGDFISGVTLFASALWFFLSKHRKNKS